MKFNSSLQAEHDANVKKFNSLMQLEINRATFKEIRKFFSENPIFYSHKDMKGNTILHKLFSEARIESCIGLLALDGSNASINAKNNDGETPFDLACKTGVKYSAKPKIKLLHKYKAELYINEDLKEDLKPFIAALLAPKEIEFSLDDEHEDLDD